jgi:hypothetical protein
MVTPMQMQMFDPREAPTATAAMLADSCLRDAIESMRRHDDREDAGWPFVENIGDAVRRAWAVDDAGSRYVVVGAVVFELDDLGIMARRIRIAAMEAFARLDAGVSA